MPRPFCPRRVSGRPAVSVFKPAGHPACDLEEVTLTLDEFEALRLADLDGLYQEQAAARLEVSRATFGRIVSSARHKVAEALVHGRSLKIEGGPVRISPRPAFCCASCKHQWPEKEAGHEGRCPRCQHNEISVVQVGEEKAPTEKKTE